MESSGNSTLANGGGAQSLIGLTRERVRQIEAEALRKLHRALTDEEE